MITNLYILICLIIFVYIPFINKEDKLYCAMKLGAFYPPNVREKKEYYRFITCNFIHIDFIHFLMNAYILYDLGQFFESLLGTMPYLYLIFISMILSSLLCYSASEVSEQSNHTITFGASGVAYGFFGAIVALAFIHGGAFYELFESFFPIIAINFVYTIFNSRVSKTGHLGGFIGGILSIVILMALKLI